MTKTETTAFEKVQKARHPDRPYTNDLIGKLFTNFTELHGDRRYSDDSAIMCGFAELDNIKVAIIGQQKGRDTNQRRFRNFGMPKPEGYRKALRVMRLAEKFGRPIITFIDTPGAYPGIDAEERGQAEAIAFNLREMAGLKVPTVSVILGEGGSGGALAIGISDRVLMMENAVYSVITPEGCAAILWKNADRSEDAAECLKLTADYLKDGGLIDEIISENKSLWTHASDNAKELNHNSQNSNDEKGNIKTFENLRKVIKDCLAEMFNQRIEDLLDCRYKKFREMGKWA